MATVEKDILQAILRDDAKAFDLAAGKHKNLSFGRFSLLAVCYLYGSRKILSTYGKAMRQGNPQRLEEDRRVYNDFARIAGKSLRLWAGYEHQDVHPLEMLAVVGDWHTLRHEFPTYVLSEIKQQRLVAAIKLRYGVTAKIEGKRLILPPKPMSNKVRVGLVALASLLVLLVLASAALLAVGLVYRSGIPLSTVVDLSAAEDGKQYVLQRDLVIEEPLNLASARINGAGHTLTVNVSDTPAFNAFGGVIEDCTVRLVGKNVSVGASYACLAMRNEGTWRNVHFVFEGEEDWTIQLEGFERGEEGAAGCAFGCLFVENAGLIENCTVEGDMRWAGQGVVDGELGAYASVNSGTIKGCTLAGNLTVDTIDIGGFVFRNEATGVIEDCTLGEDATVSQTTSVYQWSPKTGGIAATNNGTIANASVLGTVVCAKENVTYPDERISVSMVSAGGIVANNYGLISHSVLGGAVRAYGDYTAVYVGGICSDHYYDKEKSEQVAVLKQNIVAGQVYGAGYYTYIGGLAGASSGYLDANCFNGVINYSAGLSSNLSAGSILGYGNFLGEDIPQLFTDNHTVRLYYQTIFGTNTLPVIGYYEQAGTAVATLVGVTDHDTLDFSTLEAYWYGK